jgi:hypothetical protein
MRTIYVIVSVALIITGCKEEKKKSEQSQGYQDRWIAVVPSVLMREGPGLKHEVLEVVRISTKVALINESSGPDQEILGVKGKWCNVKTKIHTGWIFCPLMKFSESLPDFVVLNGKLLSKESKEYFELAGLNKCKIPEEGFKNFSGGCLQGPCHECFGEALKPDGTVAFYDQTVGGCREFGKGKWNAKDGTIQVSFQVGESVFPHDACVTRDDWRNQIIAEGNSTYGKLEAEISVEQHLSLAENGKIILDHNAIDPNAIEGKKSFAGYHFSKAPGEIKCIYPYIEPPQF